MRAADADILIVPGYSGGTPAHWYSRWLTKLSTAKRVEQKDWLTPRRDDWVETIVSASTRGHRPVIFVAHSLGCIALLHAAPRLGSAVAGAFLVAPPGEAALRDLIEGRDPETPGASLSEGRHIDAAFLPIPRAPLPFPSVMVGGSDDPYAEATFTPRLAEDVGARFIDAGAAGHINPDSGHGPWPEGSLAFAHFMAKL
ncbi:RBBP9/YdeN family alpha/beta hydrolase [Methylocystis echinoides]|uniref:Alpha/beta hydrolase n=1 Tax=Methylocystis echinoides TaxID=29468 RepID=A0A9W6GQR0_9HYPH|nr:alpha/beta hydrolase [Methylocystis echinoides]GLI91165.1 alpha/beta hydrolase [Methylocystis echinoides]